MKPQERKAEGGSPLDAAVNKIKAKNYKQLLKQINKNQQVTVTISLWTYSSPRQTFQVPFSEIEPAFKSDMEWYLRHGLNFTTVSGEQYKFEARKLKIVKVDYVEF